MITLAEADNTEIIKLLGWIVIIAVLYWVINSSVRQAITSKSTAKKRADGRPVILHPTLLAALAADIPGRYRVDGVDKATGMDTTWYTEAQSAANAKVKGELQGIVVTNVNRT